MELLLAFIMGACLMIGYFPENKPPKDEITVTVESQNNIKVRNAVTPVKAIKYRNVVKQSYDYSCGSAALATLLQYYLGEKITEKEVIQGLLKYGNKEQIAKMRAFSLLDMKKYLHALGYQGAGYKAELEDLMAPSNWPCIIPINLYDYRHFVVLKGIHEGHIFFADPFSGNTSYPISTFEKIWHKNIVFIISADHKLGLSTLKLKNEDLKYINEDGAKDAVFSRVYPFDIPGELRLPNIPGKRQHFKP